MRTTSSARKQLRVCGTCTFWRVTPLIRIGAGPSSKDLNNTLGSKVEDTALSEVSESWFRNIHSIKWNLSSWRKLWNISIYFSGIGMVEITRLSVWIGSSSTRKPISSLSIPLNSYSYHCQTNILYKRSGKYTLKLRFPEISEQFWIVALSLNNIDFF